MYLHIFHKNLMNSKAQKMYHKINLKFVCNLWNTFVFFYVHYDLSFEYEEKDLAEHKMQNLLIFIEQVANNKITYILLLIKNVQRSKLCSFKSLLLHISWSEFCGTILSILVQWKIENGHHNYAELYIFLNNTYFYRPRNLRYNKLFLILHVFRKSANYKYIFPKNLGTSKVKNMYHKEYFILFIYLWYTFE